MSFIWASWLAACTFAQPAVAQSGPGVAAASEPPAGDLASLPIEKLMDIQVVSASKFLQKSGEAPAAVTVITAADIKAFGYRTLGDVLRSTRGLYVSYDRFYQYVGVRGFKPPGDFSSRTLILINGYRINDAVYDAAAIGDDFMVDMDLVDRIEIIRGPGSAVYGSNAVFAVVNVITKKGADVGGLQVSASREGFGADQERVTYGKQFANGANVLLSASRFHRSGVDLFFPELNAPETNNGVARGLDWTDNLQLLAKVDLHQFTLTAAYARRDRGLPGAPYGIVFNDPRDHWIDETTFADLSRYDDLSSKVSLTSRVFFGLYRGAGVYPVPGPPVIATINKSLGEWWGDEEKLLIQAGRHKIVLGAEYQDNLHQDQQSYSTSPKASYINDVRSSERLGIYAEDEFTLSESLILNSGLRYDQYSNIGENFAPRAGLIWKSSAATTVKALYGTSFRAPNVYELFYDDRGVSQKANPSLRPEKIRTFELVYEHYFDPQFQLTLDAYSNRLDAVIAEVIDPADGLLVFRNGGGVSGKGVEIEVNKAWAGGAKLRTSYTWQNSREIATGREIADSPQSMAKLNTSIPVFRSAARIGAELQYVSQRRTLAGGVASPYLLTNLTLSSVGLPGGLELSTSLYNLFDVRYFDPASSNLVQDKIQQDGRSFRVKLTRTF